MWLAFFKAACGRLQPAARLDTTPGRTQHVDQLTNLKMTNNIHVLMRDTNDVYAVGCHCIKNQMHPFRKTVITILYIITTLAGIWVLREPLKS